MSVIRVNFLPAFDFGHDAVLLTMDGAAVDEMMAALSDAEARESSRLAYDGVTQEFLIEPGAADIELEKSHVVWRLDAAKAAEIVEYLDTLRGPRAGHQYVDMARPAETLVLSRDEYVDVTYPWIDPA